jgi:hypothetical protein
VEAPIPASRISLKCTKLAAPARHRRNIPESGHSRGCWVGPSRRRLRTRPQAACALACLSTRQPSKHAEKTGGEETRGGHHVRETARIRVRPPPHERDCARLELVLGSALISSSAALVPCISSSVSSAQGNRTGKEGQIR